MSSVPASIRDALGRLSDKYAIAILDRQGANSYVFKAKNKILGSDVVIKFYYWGSEAKFMQSQKLFYNLIRLTFYAYLMRT
jgi:hypothetical protein